MDWASGFDLGLERLSLGAKVLRICGVLMDGLE